MLRGSYKIATVWGIPIRVHISLVLMVLFLARDFGLLIGADLLSDTGWLLQLDVNLFGNSDNEVSVGAVYHF